jgi:ABC-2 type transport system permease protein
MSFVCIIAMYYFGEIASAIDNPVISAVLNWLSIFTRYRNFTNGIFSLADVIYYISIMVIFLFLTSRVIEKRRWA